MGQARRVMVMGSKKKLRFIHLMKLISKYEDW